MFRANIYSVEPLATVARESIHDGIGMVAAYMGEIALTKELTVKLPRNGEGNIDPKRVGYGKLDKMVELHLMAVPLDRGEDERLGLAAVGRGLSYVDVSRDNVQIIRTTTAHEVAHALGFVIAGAKHEDPESPYHCCDANCIMHKSLKITIGEPSAPSHRSKIGNLFKRASGDTHVGQIEYTIEGQHDFCTPCKVDMRRKGSEHITKLRHDRLFVNKEILN